MVNVEHRFINTAALICEPARAKMLWALLDGRAYTAGELAITADISTTAASNHLTKLLGAALIKVEVQGRHRYYSFSRPEVAYVIESLANLSGCDSVREPKATVDVKPIRFCRTCYDHLAGYAGVRITEALEQKNYLVKAGNAYLVSDDGWQWFSKMDISPASLSSRRPLTRQCLDWSERRPHLAGKLGAALFEKMISKGWFRKVNFSRELLITSKGRQQLLSLLSLEI